jgi:serine/alanine adding enzyme
MRFLTDPNEVDKIEWLNFVNSHPNGSFFHTYTMYEVYLNSNKYKPLLFIILDYDNNIIGLLLSAIIREYSGLHGLLTTRCICMGGPLVKNGNSEVLMKILESHSRAIKGKVIYSQFRNFNIQNDETRICFEKLNYYYKDHLNIIVDLSIGIELLWKGVKKNRKDGINKGKRQGFSFEVTNEDNYLDVFYELLGHTYSRAKLPFPEKEYFNNFINICTEEFKWFVLKKDEKPIIVLLAIVSNNTIFAYYIGIIDDREIIKLRPVDFFYWKVLEWGVQNGQRYFDWLGAGKPNLDSGVRKFKLQYGGEVFEMGRYEQIHKPLLFKLGVMGLKILSKIK